MTEVHNTPARAKFPVVYEWTFALAAPGVAQRKGVAPSCYAASATASIFASSECGSEASKSRCDQSARRSAASASANEGVRLAGYQGRVRQVGRAPWQATYQSHTAE